MMAWVVDVLGVEPWQVPGLPVLVLAMAYGVACTVAAWREGRPRGGA